jgi:hypothetical protein
MTPGYPTMTQRESHSAIGKTHLKSTRVLAWDRRDKNELENNAPTSLFQSATLNTKRERYKQPYWSLAMEGRENDTKKVYTREFV